MNEICDQYRAFLRTITKPGTGTIESYVRAINIITNVLRSQTKILNDNESVWEIRDVNKLLMIKNLVKQERAKEDLGIFKIEASESYIRKGFCSAAIKNFIDFLPLLLREENITKALETIHNPKTFARTLEAYEIPNEKKFIESLKSKKGKEVVREIKTRQNQHVFRKMILGNYHNRCCLSGLPIREVLRASHISPWSEDEKNRLNPENGLCLSATYDAAFDRYLISFDEDYRLILSPALKEFYKDEAFKRDFKALEGKRIEMPIRFKPSQKLLEKHRERLVE